MRLQGDSIALINVQANKKELILYGNIIDLFKKMQGSLQRTSYS